MRFDRRATLSSAIAAVSMLLSHAVAAQTAFPTKPITIIVPAAAGGPTDTVARLIAESAADGYTLAIWHIAHATAPALYESLKYDVVNDFDHLGRITDVPMTLVSKSTLPAKNVTELLQWIRTTNDKVSYGHAGVGSASHLCMLMLMKELGVQMNGIPYRGTGPAMNDLMGNQFDVMCDQTTNTTNQIKAGTIKGFAVTTKFKVSSVPNLPPLDAGAIKGFEVSAWHAMWAPKGLPKDVSGKLVAALQAALKDAKVIERFADLGTEPVKAEFATPEALKAHLIAEVPRWGAVIKASGAKGN